METIEIGRYGEFSSDGSLELEVHGNYVTDPRVFKITGMDSTGIGKNLLPVSADSKKVSGSGNGSAFFKDLPSGLYFVKNAQGRSNRRLDKYVILNVEEDTVCYCEDIDAALKTFFPVAFAARENKIIADKEKLAAIVAVETAIVVEREEFGDAEIDGFVIKPKFLDVSRESIFKMLRENTDADEVIMILSVPTSYVAYHNSIKLAEDKTAEMAVAASKAILEKRAAELLDAKEYATQAGFPTLTGSDRQIDWAIKIRAKFAEKNPGHADIGKKKTAKFWIENHRN